MNTTAGLAKCSCSHCDGHLEFETAYAGERVACPHCGRETLLYIPDTVIPPPIPSPAPVPASPVVQSAYRLTAPTEARIPAPRPMAAPPRIRPPGNPNSFARQAAKASWVSFIFAYVFAAMARRLGGTGMQPVFLVTEALFLLIGLALGVAGLRGIRKHGRKGILIPALVGVILNGVVLGVILVVILVGLNKRYRFQETKLNVATSVIEVLDQAAKEGVITRIRPTGDAQLDATLRIGADLSNDLSAALARMNSEIEALGERDVCSVLGNNSAIKSELNKRTAAQAIIQKHQLDYAAMLEATRQRLKALHLPRSTEQSVLSQLASGGEVRASFDPQFSLRLRAKKAEFNLLQFMSAQYGHYRLVNGQVSFASANQLQEFNRLSQNIRDIMSEAEAFDRQREAELQAIPDRIKQLAQ
jgi:hypothetical protein